MSDGLAATVAPAPTQTLRNFRLSTESESAILIEPGKYSALLLKIVSESPPGASSFPHVASTLAASTGIRLNSGEAARATEQMRRVSIDSVSDTFDKFTAGELAHYSRHFSLREVGPDGQFLDSDHTLRHFRERWYPRLLERDNYDRWQGKGGKTLAERAAERVTNILAKHKPDPLPEDVAHRVKAIVQQAEESLNE